MKVLIVFDSQFGNTKQIAEAIAGQFNVDSVRSLRVEETHAIDLAECDLLVVGAPTQLHGPTTSLRGLLENIPRGALRQVKVAAFDTRYRMSAFLSGSAALWIAHRLRRAGAELVAEPKSFFIERDRPPKGVKRRHELERLEPGEVARAAEWARALRDWTASVPEPASSR